MSDGTKGPVPILGIKPADPSKPPARYELRDMREKNPAQFNLLLLGMERFMDTSITPEDKPLSYFQIAGIHGMPYQNWPLAPWTEKENVVDKDAGYCTHTSILFLPWHRPYLSLFESELYKHVNAIANQYEANEDRDKYIKAARDFRLPYWDWARSTSELALFPTEVWDTTIHQVIRPKSGGKPTPLEKNPLSGYRFGVEGKKNGEINMFKKVNRTLRHANADQTSTDANVLTQLKLFIDNKARFRFPKGKNLTERTLFILQSYVAYGPMSSDYFVKNDPIWEGWGGIEDIHNAVHNYVGGVGHMQNPMVAAFDPIFWLHHCNIDRLFAIWQALHGDDKDSSKYVTREVDRDGTRGILAGSEVDIQTPLIPFHRSETKWDYYTSENVRRTQDFGYVYPETQSWIYPTRNDIAKELKRLYRQGSFANAVVTQDEAELRDRAGFIQQFAAVNALDTPTMLQAVQENQGILPDNITSQVAAVNVEVPSHYNLENLVSGGKYLEWLVNVKAEKHANDGDFAVHFFLGKPEDENPRVYILTPNHVASFSTFGQPRDTQCKKCQKDQANRLEVTGQIPLTIALVERYFAGQVGGLDVPSVEEYLKVNLHWRVTTSAGQRIPRDQIPGLLVAVVTNEVTIPDDPDGLPSYAPNVVPRPAVTTKIDSNDGRGDGTGYTGGPIPV